MSEPRTESRTESMPPRPKPDSPQSLRPAVEKVRLAIENAGPMPEHHRRVLAVHRRQWPTLWDALDELLAVPKR